MKPKADLRRRIAVDFDGVLCHGLGRYEDRTPDFGQISRVRDLAAAGWRVFVWTSRAPTFEGKRRSEAWLRRFGVPFERLVMGKPIFDATIDDRALPELPASLEVFLARVEASTRFRSEGSLAARSKSPDEKVKR